MAEPTVLVDLTSLNTDSRFRGIGRYVRDLAIGLSRLAPSERAGLRLVGLTSYDWSGRCELTEDLASFAGLGDRPEASAHYVWAYKRRAALWAAARRTGARVVHMGEPAGTPLAFALSGARLVMTCHDLIDRHFPARYVKAIDGGRYLAAALQQRRYRHADWVVAISEATRDDVVRFLGIAPSRVRRVYNGVDIARWASPPPPSAFGVLDRLRLRGVPFVLYVGDTDWRKNVEGMLAGLAIARAGGSDARLVFAGMLSEERIAQLEGEASARGVADAVVRAGYVADDELSALFRAARAHLFVSRIEGFGLTVVEAMAAGCPVITTRRGSLAEVAGNAGLAVDPEDHDAIGDAIARVCESAALRDDLARRGAEQAARFSLERQARAMVEVYREAAT